MEPSAVTEKMTVSDRGVELVAKYEGCRLEVEEGFIRVPDIWENCRGFVTVQNDRRGCVLHIVETECLFLFNFGQYGKIKKSRKRRGATITVGGWPF